MEFHERLAKLRKDKGVTQDEVADYLHISRQAISKWELGLSEPSLYDVKQLAAFFDVSIEELIGDEKKKDVSSFKERTKKVTDIISIIISVAFILFSLFVYIFAFDKIPAHANASGVVDRYGSRLEILILPLVYIVVFILFQVFIRFGLSKFVDEYSFESDKQYKFSLSVLFSVPIFIALVFIGLIVFLTVTMYFNDGTRSASDIYYQIFGLVIGGVFLTLGCLLHPKYNKMNILFGIKTRYALSSKEAWKKCNSLGSYICVGFSLLILMLSTFLNSEIVFFSCLGIIFLMGVSLFVMSYILSKKDAKS